MKTVTTDSLLELLNKPASVLVDVRIVVYGDNREHTVEAAAVLEWTRHSDVRVYHGFTRER